MIIKIEEVDCFFGQDYHISDFINIVSCIKKCQELNIDKFNVVSLEQSMEIIVNATEYFLKNYLEPPGSNSSWGCRDSHWLTTIMRLNDKMPDVNNRTTNKMIIWAHNSHIGNALHTERGGIDFQKNALLGWGRQYKKSATNA